MGMGCQSARTDNNGKSSDIDNIMSSNTWHDCQIGRPICTWLLSDFADEEGEVGGEERGIGSIEI